MIGLGLGINKSNSGGGNSFDSDFLAWESQVGISSPPARRQIENEFFIDLKSAGLFSLFDRIFLFATYYQSQARVSLVNPSSSNLVEVNAPIWTQDSGYNTAGASYLNTNFDEINDGVNWSPVNSNGGLSNTTSNWIDTSAGISTGATNSSVDGTYLRNRRDTTLRFERQFKQTTVGKSASTVVAGTGHLFTERGSSGLSYQNGSSLGSGGGSGGLVLTSNNYYIGGLNRAGALTNGVECNFHEWAIGSPLNGTQVLAYYNAVKKYLDAINLNILP